jgi:hypothetical protein
LTLPGLGGGGAGRAGCCIINSANLENQEENRKLQTRKFISGVLRQNGIVCLERIENIYKFAKFRKYKTLFSN